MLLDRFWVHCKWPLKSENKTCNLSGICSFYNIIVLAPIATIFIYLIDFSVVNLMVLKGASAKYVTFYSAQQCSHCKRCTSYGNSVRLSVCPSVRLSHAGIVLKRLHVARCSLHCQIAKSKCV